MTERIDLKDDIAITEISTRFGVLANLSAKISKSIRDNVEWISKYIRLQYEENPQWVEAYFKIPELHPDDNTAQIEIERRMQWLFNYKIRQDHPTQALVYTTHLKAQLRHRDSVKSSNAYLRLLGEWITSATYSWEFLSVESALREIEGTIREHINKCYRESNILNQDAKLSDDAIIEYRMNLPLAIIALSQYYVYTWINDAAKNWIRIGAQVTTHMDDGLHKIELLFLEIQRFINAWLPIDEELRNILVLTRACNALFQKSATNQKTKDRTSIQFRIYELTLTSIYTKDVNLSLIVNILKARQELLQSPLIDIEDRVRLAQIEIEMYIRYQLLIRTPEFLSDISANKDDREYIKNFIEKIADKTQWFDLTQYSHGTNARLFLSPLIKLFSFRVRELTSSDPRNHDRIVNSLKESMLQIYAIAIWYGDVPWNLAIFARISSYKSFIESSRDLMNFAGEDIASTEVIGKLGTLYSDQQQRNRASHELIIKDIRWISGGTIHSIDIEEVSDKERSIVYSSSNIYSSEKLEDDLVSIKPIYIQYDGRIFHYAVKVLKNSPLTDSAMEQLIRSLNNLTPFEYKKSLTRRFNKVIEMTREEVINLLGHVTEDIQEIGTYVRGGGNKIIELLQNPDNPASTNRWLSELNDHYFFSIAKIGDRITRRVQWYSLNPPWNWDWLAQIESADIFSPQEIIFPRIIRILQRKYSGKDGLRIDIHDKPIRKIKRTRMDPWIFYKMMDRLIETILLSGKDWQNINIQFGLTWIDDWGYIFEVKDDGIPINQAEIDSFKSMLDESDWVNNSSRLKWVSVINQGIKLHGWGLDISSHGKHTTYRFTIKD
jgi:hypothetical protein